jgi:hypothetical protein
MRLRPLQGPTQRGPPTFSTPAPKSVVTYWSATLMEFLPLRRLSPSESTCRRFATPTTFRPQGFAPSRRFTPRPNARPCFIPVTPMGFHSPGVFPHCQVSRAPRSRDYPLDVFSSAPRSKLRNAGRLILRNLSKETASQAFIRLQGLAPTANPYRC